MSAPHFAVIVGNVGCVFHTSDSGPNAERAARAVFDAYMALSSDGIGRAAGESVTLLRAGEPIAEYAGEVTP